MGIRVFSSVASHRQVACTTCIALVFSYLYLQPSSQAAAGAGLGGIDLDAMRSTMSPASVIAGHDSFAGSAWRSGVASEAQASADADLGEQVDALMKQAALDGLGGAVVLERNGHMLLSSGYGLANRRSRLAFTEDTVAPINSITKSVTALGVVQLATVGRIDLQAPLSAYLKGIREPAGSSRIHDVLVHHAGLPPHCGDDWERRTKAQLIEECSQQPLVAARGALSYSNPGYSYLSALVEEVSGQTWEDYLRIHVFEPAGMRRSGWPFGKYQGSTLAEGYVEDAPRAVPADRLAALGGDVWNWKGNGELYASATDMHRLSQFLMRQPAHIIQPMITPQGPEYGAGVRDGYGFALRFDRSGRIYRIGSSGSDGAFVSYFMWLPQQGVFMYFVGNNGENRVRPVLTAVIDAIQKSVGAGQ